MCDRTAAWKMQRGPPPWLREPPSDAVASLVVEGVDACTACAAARQRAWLSGSRAALVAELCGVWAEGVQTAAAWEAVGVLAMRHGMCDAAVRAMCARVPYDASCMRHLVPFVGAHILRAGTHPVHAHDLAAQPSTDRCWACAAMPWLRANDAEHLRVTVTYNSATAHCDSSITLPSPSELSRASARAAFVVSTDACGTDTVIVVHRHTRVLSVHCTAPSTVPLARDTRARTFCDALPRAAKTVQSFGTQSLAGLTLCGTFWFASTAAPGSRAALGAHNLAVWEIMAAPVACNIKRAHAEAVRRANVIESDRAAKRTRRLAECMSSAEWSHGQDAGSARPVLTDAFLDEVCFHTDMDTAGSSPGNSDPDTDAGVRCSACGCGVDAHWAVRLSCGCPPQCGACAERSQTTDRRCAVCRAML